ncbi:MAG: helicase HerA domain-containing protein, partial [Halolamina sp.]
MTEGRKRGGAAGRGRRSPREPTILGRRDRIRHGTSHSVDPRGSLGTYRAADGSDGAPVAVDFDRPHACLLVGKRGSGKSHTLGVIAEGLTRADGVAPIVVDPMGELL